MNVGEIKDLCYDWYLKILSKLHEPLGECNLKEFSNIMSGVHPLLEHSYDYLSFFMTERVRKDGGKGVGS